MILYTVIFILPVGLFRSCPPWARERSTQGHLSGFILSGDRYKAVLRGEKIWSFFYSGDRAWSPGTFQVTGRGWDYV